MIQIHENVVHAFKTIKSNGKHPLLQLSVELERQHSEELENGPAKTNCSHQH